MGMEIVTVEGRRFGGTQMESKYDSASLIKNSKDFWK